MRARRLSACLAAVVTTGSAALVATATPAAADTTANTAASSAGYTATFAGATRRSAVGRGGAFDYLSGELTVTCTGGVAFYEAAASTNPERSSGAVSPGDRLAVSLIASRAATTATLTNTTTGGVFRSTGNGITATTAQANVQGGFDGQSFPRPLAFQFQGVKIDKAPLATFAPQVFDQVQGGTLLLETSPLTVNGLAFSVKFRSQP